MRRLLSEITQRIGSFVGQRDDLVLVLSAREADALPLLSILEGIEAERGSDFFWTFNDPFDNPAAYAAAVIDGFAVKHEAVRLAMEKEGMKPWPPIPAGVRDASAPPAARLRELAAFSRGLPPVPDAGVSVWTFFPLQIRDGAAYARLMQAVIAHEFPYPWCHHLRFILRDDPAAPVLDEALKEAPRVDHFAPDLSAEAVNQSLEAEAADETLPLSERMSSLLVSAGNDLAFERFPAALEKYALLLQYHGSSNHHALAAVSLNGMGQVYERMGDLEKAGQAYQAALIPASEGEPPPIPVFLNVILSLANLRTTQENWVEAEGYWDSAQQLATPARDGPLKIRALEQRGLCQERQKKLEEAEQSWKAGSVVAAQLEDADSCGRLLERLHGLYQARGDTAKDREVREQLAGLGRPVAG